MLLFASYRISSEFKYFLRPFVFLLGTTVFILFATGGIAIIIESKNGWILAISKSIAYPASCFIVLLMWVLGAEKFTDSVRQIVES